MAFVMEVETLEPSELEAEVLDVRSRAVLLDRTPFHPRSLEQPSDRGWLRWKDAVVGVRRVERERGGGTWHLLEVDCAPARRVQAVIDHRFRLMMRQLHTDLHILGGLVYLEFKGALVIGVQMNANGTAHIDFDMPEIDNLKLRSLQGEVNTTISRGLEVRERFVSSGAVRGEPGLLRGRRVTWRCFTHGTLRVIEIVGLDRQACDGRHVDNTAESPPIRIVKVRNLGRRARRVYIGLEEPRDRKLQAASELSAGNDVGQDGVAGREEDACESELERGQCIQQPHLFRRTDQEETQDDDGTQQFREDSSLLRL